jgi:hypothetical protein
MSVVQQNSKEYFKTLKILHIALIAGQVLFAIIVVSTFIKGKVVGLSELFISIVDYTLFFAFILCVPASYYLFKLKINKLKTEADLKTKMNGYRTALIKRYSIFQIPSFVSIVAVMLTTNYYYLVVTAMIVILMLFLRPSRENTIRDLALNYSEIAVLDDPNAIISEFEKKGA